MAITEKDFAALQPGVNEITQQRGATQRMLQDAKLKELLLGNSLEMARGEAARQGLKPGKYSMAASPGSFSVNPENENPLIGLNLADRQMARDDHDLTKVGERVAKAELPISIAAAANLERGTADAKSGQGGMITNPNYEVKSAGPIANLIRGVPGGQGMLNIGEKVGLMPKGSGNEMALAQRLMNMDIKNLSGTAVSAAEQGRQNIEKGLTAGGSPDLVKVGIKQMVDAFEAEGKNIESSTRPQVMDTFKKQGGVTSLKQLLGSPQMGGASGGQKTPAKKLYSPSRNQTKIVYSDGTEEVVDGQQ